MSLLMKALEKAAHDRSNTTGQPFASPTSAPAGTPAAGGQTLSLEPVLPAAASTSFASSAAAKSAASFNPNSSALPGASGHSARSTRRSDDQTRAAGLLSTQGKARAGAVEWISTHPVPFAAALAGVLALGYAIYLYLQIAHPYLFMRAPATPAQPAAAVTPAPVAPASSPPLPSQDAGAVDTALVSAQSVFSSNTGAIVQAPQPTSAPAGTIVSKPAPAKAAPAILSATPAAAAIVAPPAAPSKIMVSRGDSAVPRVNSALSDAYAALESGRFDAARPLYEQALRSEPHNIDALLGLAAIAQHENRTDDASKIYLRILDIDPRHALAQTGLIALLGRADPWAAETRLKQLAARDPSPSLFFTLGNLYADQGQWSQAQQAYFQSHHLEPGNPDYAYNLAVALEHLGQQKLALGFYRRALQLAAGRGRANFNSSLAQARVSQLAARLE